MINNEVHDCNNCRYGDFNEHFEIVNCIKENNNCHFFNEWEKRTPNDRFALFERAVEKLYEGYFKICAACCKKIKNDEPYIIAYRNGVPSYYCREHFSDAEKYLNYYQEFVELKEINND